MLYYQIQIDVFWTAMLSYLHALAVAGANGITAEQFLPYVSDTLSSLPMLLEFYTSRIDAGKHQGDVEKLAMGMASIEHVVQTSKEAGIDASLPAAVLEVFKRGVDNGHANDSFTSLIEMFKSLCDRIVRPHTIRGMRFFYMPKSYETILSVGSRELTEMILYFNMHP